MRYYLSVLITIILFSSIEVFSKVLHGSIDVMLLAFFRFFISGIVLLLIDFKKLKTISLKDYKIIFIIGVLGVTGTFTFFHKSLTYIDASVGAVIFSINPLFCSIFAIFFHKEHIKGYTIAGLLIGLIGVYIVSFGFNYPELNNIKGPIYMLMASILFSLYIVWSKKYVKKYGAFAVTGKAFFTGSIFMIPLVSNWSIPTETTQLSALFYLIFFTTALAYILYFYGLKHLSVAVGTSFFYLKPVFAPILAVIILKESLSLTFYLGVATILASLSLTIISSKKEKSSS